MKNYSINHQNKVKQLRENANYEKKVVHQILDAGLVAHVAFNQDDHPIVVPMIYGRENETIFLHGARKARIIRMLEKTHTASLNVTLLDGIVFARSTFNSSMNYRSATIFGVPKLIDDRDEKLHAMQTISEHTLPGRWIEVRASKDREIKMTGIIKLAIESASAKVSSGMPEDEDEDYEIPIWAGVLPIKSQLGIVEDDDRLLPNIEPSAAVLAMQNRII